MSRFKYNLNNEEITKFLDPKTDCNHFSLDKSFGKIAMYNDLLSKQLRISRYVNDVKKKTQLKISSDCNFDYVIFNFTLTGANQSWMAGWQQKENFNAGTFSLIYSPLMEGYSNYNCDSINTGIGILIKRENLREQLIDDPRAAVKKLFLPILLDNPQAMVMHGKMTAQMIKIVQNINMQRSPSMLRRFGHQSMIYQLLQLATDTIISEKCRQDSLLNLSMNDVEKLKKAKKLIAEKIQNPPSLIELSHEIGLNDFKLKKGFKQLYQQTVFEYVHSLRMNDAAKYLQQSQLPIIEVADKVGFNNHGHFSVAFKKYFGHTPSHYREKTLAL